MIIGHPRHPSHLCQDPDSILRTFLEQYVLVFVFFPSKLQVLFVPATDCSRGSRLDLPCVGALHPDYQAGSGERTSPMIMIFECQVEGKVV